MSIYIEYFVLIFTVFPIKILGLNKKSRETGRHMEQKRLRGPASLAL